MNELGHKNRASFKRNYINPLLETKEIVMTNPLNPTSRNQKYVVNNIK